MKIDKKYIILAAAIIVPFGLVALGLWKTYELLNKEVGDDELDKTE
jgi:hypothetical protein